MNIESDKQYPKLAFYIYVDIRNFTQFCNDPSTNQVSHSFLLDFFNLITKIFPEFPSKFTGDGALIIINDDCEKSLHPSNILKDIYELLNGFENLKKKHFITIGKLSRNYN